MTNHPSSDKQRILGKTGSFKSAIMHSLWVILLFRCRHMIFHLPAGGSVFGKAQSMMRQCCSHSPVSFALVLVTPCHPEVLFTWQLAIINVVLPLKPGILNLPSLCLILKHFSRPNATFWLVNNKQDKTAHRSILWHFYSGCDCCYSGFRFKLYDRWRSLVRNARVSRLRRMRFVEK